MNSNIEMYVVVLFLLLFGEFPKIKSESRSAFLHHRPEVSLFFDRIEKSPYLKSALSWKEGTLFAPTNDAIKHFEEVQLKQFDHMTLLYHFANIPHRYSEISNEKSISTEMPGNPFLWISTLEENNAKTIFVNDARINKWDNIVEVEGSSKQYIHIIDAVLEPTVPIGLQGTYLHNPDAWKFIEHTQSYKISNGYQTKHFSRQISIRGKHKLFTDVGRHTFFVPVDKDMTQLNLDEAVINGHIIQNQALFLRSVELNKEFETYRATGTGAMVQVSSYQRPANESLHVVLSFDKGRFNGQEKWLIQSDTRHGDSTHRKGVVQAEILKANIPVKNGVVHLISKPLVIIDTDVFDTLEWYGGKFIFNMKSFLDIIREMERRGFGNEYKNILKDRRGVTLFVPSNEALQDPEFIAQRNNVTAMTEIIKTHILKKIVSADDMIENSINKRMPYQVPTMIRGKQLLFSVIHPHTHHGETILHLEGGGVNATILHADFGATNGFIHIIDKVLGIPKQSVIEKLRTNPMLQSTYHLWKKARMDEKYNESQSPFTIFAPSEKAWQNIRQLNNDAYQNLFFSTEGNMKLLTSVLERHILTRQDRTIQELKFISESQRNTTLPLPKVLQNATNIIMKFPIETAAKGSRISVNESHVLLPPKSWGGKGMMDNKPKIQQQFPTTSTSSPQYVEFQNSEMDSHYYVYWNKMWAHVIRPNVKCTNGILHIIDDVLMDYQEIAVASANTLFQNSTFTSILICLVLLLAILIEMDFF